MFSLSESLDWARREFGGVLLGDRRRTSRLVRVSASLFRRSSASLPKQMDDWSDLKAAYRLLSSASVTHESVGSDHWRRTREVAGQPNQGLILFVQDTTELDFSTHRATEGLGFAGNGKGLGIEVHTTLAVQLASGVPGVFGVAAQLAWVRDHAPRVGRESDSARRKRHTEYDVWEDSLLAIGPAPRPDSGTRWVSVGDRASDVFSYMSRACELGWHVVVRSKYDRKLGSEEKFHALARSASSAGERTLHLRTRATVKARDVPLNIAYFKVDLPPTRGNEDASSLAMTGVRVWEESSKGDALEWIILTNLPVDSLESAWEIADIYRVRWLIEEFHKCLKTGCSLEKRQVGTKTKLLSLLAIFSVVSVYLLRFKAAPSPRAAPADIVAVLKAVTKAKEDLNNPEAFWRRVAMLGGFLGRKGDGKPGWQSLWTGWTRLLDILIGIQVAKEMRCG